MKKASAKIRRKVALKFCREINTMEHTLEFRSRQRPTEYKNNKTSGRGAAPKKRF